MLFDSFPEMSDSLVGPRPLGFTKLNRKACWHDTHLALPVNNIKPDMNIQPSWVTVISRGLLPYISHIGMFRPKWYGYGLFRSLNEYTLCPFWSGIGYGFRENYGSVWTYLPLQFQINKKEIEICQLEMLFKTSFVCALIWVTTT